MIHKFRYFNKLTKEMVTSDFVVSSQGRVIDTYNNNGWVDMKDTAILMQSTGLFDNNGVEIFEGDGVAYRGDSYIVAKKDAAMGLALLRNKEITSFKPLVNDLVDFDKLEVLGNIHEHPHLVEGRNGMD